MYTYDENGNVVFKDIEWYEKTNDGEESISGSVTGLVAEGEATAFYYTYNNFNQLVNVENDKGMTASYDYDALGRRNSKTGNGTTSRQVWDGDNIVYEADSNWGKVASYYRGTNLVAIDNGVIDYYLCNSHGDVVGMKNEGSTIVYDAFGNQKQDTTENYNPFRYNGQYTDEETGLIYLRARYYDPATGRFVSKDTHWNPENMIYGDNVENKVPDISAIMQSGNLYAYCMSNPVMLSDPSGLKPGELFENPELLALDFAINYSKASVEYGDEEWKEKFGKGIEYGALIYTVETSKGIRYAYSDVQIGNNDGIGDPRYSINYSDVIIPEDEKKAGIIHTHAANGNANPSTTDYNTFREISGVHFLINPAGEIKKYVTQGGVWIRKLHILWIMLVMQIKKDFYIRDKKVKNIEKSMMIDFPEVRVFIKVIMI